MVRDDGSHKVESSLAAGSYGKAGAGASAWHAILRRAGVAGVRYALG